MAQPRRPRRRPSPETRPATHPGPPVIPDRHRRRPLRPIHCQPAPSRPPRRSSPGRPPADPRPTSRPAPSPPLHPPPSRLARPSATGRRPCLPCRSRSCPSGERTGAAPPTPRPRRRGSASVRRSGRRAARRARPSRPPAPSVTSLFGCSVSRSATFELHLPTPTHRWSRRVRGCYCPTDEGRSSRGGRRHRSGRPDVRHRGDPRRPPDRGHDRSRHRRGHRGHPWRHAGPDRPLHGQPARGARRAPGPEGDGAGVDVSTRRRISAGDDDAGRKRRGYGRRNDTLEEPPRPRGRAAVVRPRARAGAARRNRSRSTSAPRQNAAASATTTPDPRLDRSLHLAGRLDVRSSMAGMVVAKREPDAGRPRPPRHASSRFASLAGATGRGSPMPSTAQARR